MSDTNGNVRKLDLQAIRTDPRRLVEGTWFEIWFNQDTSIDGKRVEGPTNGPCVLVVPFGRAYKRIVDEELRSYRERLEANAMTDDDVRAIDGRVLGRAAFRGCHNIEIGGEPVVWTEAKAIELMTDDQWSRLREFVFRKGSDCATSAAREEAQAKGN